jgi:diketogulonate reductase-like aldo/keto reductase
VFDFELTDSEMGEIRTLNNGNKIFPDPDNIDF